MLQNAILIPNSKLTQTHSQRPRLTAPLLPTRLSDCAEETDAARGTNDADQRVRAKRAVICLPSDVQGTILSSTTQVNRCLLSDEHDVGCRQRTD
jgi:hypothetical protein